MRPNHIPPPKSRNVTIPLFHFGPQLNHPPAHCTAHPHCFLFIFNGATPPGHFRPLIPAIEKFSYKNTSILRAIFSSKQFHHLHQHVLDGPSHSHCARISFKFCPHSTHTHTHSVIYTHPPMHITTYTYKVFHSFHKRLNEDISQCRFPRHGDRFNPFCFLGISLFFLFLPCLPCQNFAKQKFFQLPPDGSTTICFLKPFFM